MKHTGKAARHITHKKTRFLLFAVIIVAYLLTVLWYTVLSRPQTYYGAQTEAFWSYKAWLCNGNIVLGREILANIAMFLPVGFLSSAVLTFFWEAPTKWSLMIIAATFAGALLSLTIESLQYVLMRGYFEWDDLMNNTIGAILGATIFQSTEKHVPQKSFANICTAVNIAFLITCAVIFLDIDHNNQWPINTPRAFCFQIDEISADPDFMLTGIAFLYDRKAQPFTLRLQSTRTGETINLPTVKQFPREDINRYFSAGNDYNATGFTVVGSPGYINPTEEYEIIAIWPPFLMFSTGVYITGLDVHYYPECEFMTPCAEGTDLNPIIEKGILRVYQPEQHCWIYQYDGSLYWIADRGFTFEQDGTTYIQYQLWTTQIERLPEERLVNHNYWDNISGCFEEYELTGNFANYRVMKRDIPTAYPITSIVTGYYTNGAWVWKNYFRPIYQF